MASAWAKWVNSTTGPKTVHFWGPVANWGIVFAGIADMNKPVEMVSLNMTGVLSVYSMLFMRFAWMVTPRNYLLLACHAANESVQLYQLQRKLRHEYGGGKSADVAAVESNTLPSPTELSVAAAKPAEIR